MTPTATQDPQPQPIHAYLAKIGRKGGKVKSPAKAAACRANGAKGGRKPRQAGPKTK